MSTLKRCFCAGLLICSSMGLVGCGNGVDENKPMNEVQAESKEMDADALRDTAMAYKDAIQDKMQDVDKITAKLKEIPVTEMLGEEAKSLKGEIDQLTKSVDALKQRLNVYLQRLKEMKEDISGLEL